jgi:hypothetical protein
MDTALTAFTEFTAFTVVIAVTAAICQPLHPLILKGCVIAVLGWISNITKGKI